MDGVRRMEEGGEWSKEQEGEEVEDVSRHEGVVVGGSGMCHTHPGGIVID